MAHLIDKSALVAEIEKMKERFVYLHHKDGIDWPLDNYGKMRAYNEILSILNTIEVKDVDLESLVKDFCNEYDDRKEKWYELCPNDRRLINNPTWANFAMSIAKHFFELGMAVSNKAQKGG